MKSARSVMFAKRAAAVIVAPTLVSTTPFTVNTTSPKTSTSITVQAGDTLIVTAGGGDQTVTISTPTSTGITFTLLESILVTNYDSAYVWSATAPSSGNITVTLTRSGGTTDYGGTVWVWRGSAGVGAHTKTNVSSGAPSLAVTTLAANSAVLCYNGDWNAGTGTRTWRTVNSITPTSGNGLETRYGTVAGGFTYYAAYWSNVGAAGSKTIGLSAPTGQKYSIIGVEIKGQ